MVGPCSVCKCKFRADTLRRKGLQAVTLFTYLQGTAIGIWSVKFNVVWMPTDALDMTGLDIGCVNVESYITRLTAMSASHTTNFSSI